MAKALPANRTLPDIYFVNGRNCSLCGHTPQVLVLRGSSLGAAGVSMWAKALASNRTLTQFYDKPILDTIMRYVQVSVRLVAIVCLVLRSCGWWQPARKSGRFSDCRGVSHYQHASVVASEFACVWRRRCCYSKGAGRQARVERGSFAANNHCRSRLSVQLFLHSNLLSEDGAHTCVCTCRLPSTTTGGLPARHLLRAVSCVQSRAT